MNEKLKAFGFACIEPGGGYEVLSCVIGKAGEDRFTTEIIIYTDTPGIYYINRHLLSGTTTMSVEDVMRNHNNLHDVAKLKLIEFIKEFPDMKSAI